MKLACGCDNALPHTCEILECGCSVWECECGADETPYDWEGTLTVVNPPDDGYQIATEEWNRLCSVGLNPSFINFEQTPEQQRERINALLEDNRITLTDGDTVKFTLLDHDGTPVETLGPLVASGGQCAPMPAPRIDMFTLAPFGGTVPKTPRGGISYVTPPTFPEGDPNMADYANRASEPSPEFEYVREGYAQTLADWLRDTEGLEGEEITVFGPEAVVGPKGGHSQQILLAVEVDGEVQCVIVQVYCDPATKRALEALLQKKAFARAEDKRLRKQIVKAVKD